MIKRFAVSVVLFLGFGVFCYSAGLVDHVDCGDAASESVHNVSGAGKTGMAGDKIGTRDEFYSVRASSVKKEAFSYEINIGSELPLTIEVRESHNKWDWKAKGMKEPWQIQEEAASEAEYTLDRQSV